MQHEFKVGDEVYVMLYDEAIRVDHVLVDVDDGTVMGEARQEWDLMIADRPVFQIVGPERGYEYNRWTVKCPSKNIAWSIPEALLIPANKLHISILF